MTMASISGFCENMRMACDDWDLGYDQSNRYDIRDGGECDCSSLVIWALGRAGFDTGGSSYTGDMSDELCARGWERIPADIGDCRPGDILLNDTYHVCAVIEGYGWDATIAQASIDERGRATGGESGDQTDGETVTKPVYEYWAGWDCILRWDDSDWEDDDLGGDLGGDGDEPRRALIDRRAVSLWQAVMGTPVDGTISGQDWEDEPYTPALTAVERDGAFGGSQLVRAIQRRVGVNPDGKLGPATVRAIQRRVGTDTDGYLGELTAGAILDRLEDGEF